MECVIGGMRVVGVVRGSGKYFVPSPNTIFSVGLRLYSDRLKISMLVIFSYFLAKSALMVSCR